MTEEECRVRTAMRLQINRRLREIVEAGVPSDRDTADLLVLSCSWLDKQGHEQPVRK